MNPETSFGKTGPCDEPVRSRIVKAGHRTYFFDVRTTRGNDCFVTITESRKTERPDGSAVFERHKIFLYKEDFEKFAGALAETIGDIRRSRPELFVGEDAAPTD